LETETFGWSDLTDIDRGESAEGSFGTPGLPVGGDGPKGLDWVPTLAGNLASDLTEGLSRATISAAHGLTTITIHADPTRGLEGLNRDLELAQEILNQEESAVRVYVSSDALQGLNEGVELLSDVIDRVVGALTPQQVGELRAQAASMEDLKAAYMAQMGVSAAEAERALVVNFPALVKAATWSEQIAFLDAAGVDAGLVDRARRHFMAGGSLKLDPDGRPIVKNGAPVFLSIPPLQVAGLDGGSFQLELEYYGEDATFLKRSSLFARTAMAEAEAFIETVGPFVEYGVKALVFTALAFTTGPGAAASHFLVDELRDAGTAWLMDGAYEALIIEAAEQLQGVDDSLTDEDAVSLSVMLSFAPLLAVGGVKAAKLALSKMKGVLRVVKTPQGNAATTLARTIGAKNIKLMKNGLMIMVN
jgi:hypothetical protein